MASFRQSKYHGTQLPNCQAAMICMLQLRCILAGKHPEAAATSFQHALSSSVCISLDSFGNYSRALGQRIRHPKVEVLEWSGERCPRGQYLEDLKMNSRNSDTSILEAVQTLSLASAKFSNKSNSTSRHSTALNSR